MIMTGSYYTTITGWGVLLTHAHKASAVNQPGSRLWAASIEFMVLAFKRRAYDGHSFRGILRKRQGTVTLEPKPNLSLISSRLKDFLCSGMGLKELAGSTWRGDTTKELLI